MIVEFGELPVEAKNAAAFRQAWQRASEILLRQPGYISHRLGPKIEDPEVFVLEIEWQTLEAHVEGFAKSDVFSSFVGQISPYFSGSPTFFHFAVDEPISGNS